MNDLKIATALSHEALYGKSKVYITRGLNAKSRADHGEYQLWASLALELLGKSALAAIHPSLVADPQSYISLFAAAGINIDTDIKTIIAKTVFERLTHVSAQGKKQFDTNTAKFCQDMALKRNCSATIWMEALRRTGRPIWRSRRGDDCRAATVTQAIFS